ncbi:hypothetical protein [Oscillatoria sp. HE19RPO]|nr:hypothetical protein [Oscillatoria sp. HE19RPO]
MINDRQDIAHREQPHPNRRTGYLWTSSPIARGFNPLQEDRQQIYPGFKP